MVAGGLPGPTLDTSGEPWLGSFPGLGTVLVHSDGSVIVRLEPDAADEPEDAGQRERALRYGWGEPLSFVRRGFACASATGVVPPDPDQGCLLLVGAPHETAIVLLELVRRGWSVLGDRFVPTTWSGDSLLAHPREAPVLVSRRRAEKAGLTGKKTRENTDAVEIDVPRTTSPVPVAAVVLLQRRRPHEGVVEDVRGYDRFDAAGRLMLPGVFAPAYEPYAEAARTMGEHLRLSALPIAHLRFDPDSIGDDGAGLIKWWQAQAAASRAAAT